MGRQLPKRDLTTKVRREVELARAVDAAVAESPADDDVMQVIERLNGSLDGPGGNGAAGGNGGTATADAAVRTLPIVFLDGLEVTQEIQDLAHSVPLVAGRTTVVRAYLRYAPGPVQVRGELKVSRHPFGPWHTVSSTGTASLDPSRSGGALADLRTRRADLGFSLNFRLPECLTGTGDLFVRMGPVRRVSGTPLPSLAGLPVRRVEFRPAAPLRLRLVRFQYTMNGATHEPSTLDVDLFGSWLRRAYPVARVELTTTTATAAPAAPFDASLINAQLIAMRAVDVGTGTDARTHYYGMVADSGFFMRGLASGIPQTPDPATVASGPTGPSTFGWDNDGSYGDWYGGHELGHTMGRFHAEFCGAAGGAPYPFPNGQLSGPDEEFVGLDVGDAALGLPMKVMGGVASHDVMSYCNDEWLSSFTYTGIYDRLVAEDALPAGPAVGPGGPAGAFAGLAVGNGEPSMRMIAAVNLTSGSGVITSVLPGGGSPGAAAGGPSGLTVRVRDAAGTVLDERPATFLPSACEDPDADRTGVVDVTLPDLAAASTVDIVLDGAVIDSHPVGGEPAVGGLVEAERDAAGPGGAPTDAVQLRWAAPDAPPSQRYIVQISEDGGRSWQTVATGLTDPSITLSTAGLTGDEVTVRLLATTGTGVAAVREEQVRLR